MDLLAELGLDSVDTSDPHECWIWHGTRPGNYIRRQPNGPGTESVNVHRRVYESVHGPVPKGLVVHHECQDKRCFNPGHLIAVTHSEHRRLHPGPKVEPPVALLIRMPAELHAAIKAKAAREERSMAQAIRNALRAWTEEG